MAGVLLIASPASAGPTVDPSTLTPPPPPGAECRLDGRWIICQTSFVSDLVNEPIFVLPCGQLYETSHDVRSGIRFYNADLRVHANWWIVLAVPGDESTGELTQHGNEFTLSSPGSGVLVHIAGLDLPEGDHRGVFRVVEEDPQVAADVCEVLTG